MEAKTLINLELTHKQPSKVYAPLVLTDSKLFAGYIIRNQYDEQRIEIDRKFNPQRFLFSSNNLDYYMYGLLQNSKHRFIEKIQNSNMTSLSDYNYALALEGLSCITCFLHFDPGLYPIDSSYLPRYFPAVNFSEFNVKKNVPSFQKVSHIYFFALVNCKK